MPFGQMLSAVLHDLGIVLAQTPLDHTGEKAEEARAAAPTLVARLDWIGRVLMGNALDCQVGVCETVREAGGERARSEPMPIVKAHQATLLRAHDALRLPCRCRTRRRQFATVGDARGDACGQGARSFCDALPGCLNGTE